MVIEWPVPQSVEGVLGIMNGKLDATFIRGFLPKLMAPMDSSVVFAYRSETSDEISFIDIFREEPLKSLKNEFPGVCSFLRKKFDENMDWYNRICLPNDTRATRYIYGIYEGAHMSLEKPSGWHLVLENMGLQLYQYTCDETCFVEFIVPVIVDFNVADTTGRKIIGAFISGQFKSIHDDFHPCKLCSTVITERMRLDDFDKDEMQKLDDEIKLEYTKNKLIPSEECLINFVGMIADFSRMMGIRHSELLHSHSRRIMQKIDDVIWDNSSNTEIDGNGLENFEQRLVNLNNRLLSGLGCLLEENAAGFSRIHVSMPKQHLDQFDPIHKINRQESFFNFWVDGEERNGSWTPRINLLSKCWINIINGNKKDILLKGATVSSYKNENEFLSDLEEMFPGIVGYIEDNKISVASFGVYVFTTQRHRNYPLVFLIEDNNPNRLCDKYIIQDIFENAAEKYLTQWNEIFSDYQRFFIEVGAGYIDHELGQVQSGIESLAREALDSYVPIADFLKPMKTPSSVKEAIYKTKDFAKDILAFNRLTELISKHQLSSMFSTEPTFTEFNPYGDVLYELNAIYKSQCQLEGKFTIIKPLETVRTDDRYSSQMYTDKNIFMIIVNNLIRNAIKYSWPGTLIYIDCKLNDDHTKWVLKVTNYGRFISKDDKNEIFGFRMRGDNARDASGMGIGLYLVKFLTETLLHGSVGLEHERISEMCIPAFQYFTNKSHDFIPEDQYNTYYGEYKRLSASKIYGKVMNGPFGALTWREAKAMIDIPTDTFCFIVELPHKK